MKKKITITIEDDEKDYDRTNAENPWGGLPPPPSNGWVDNNDICSKCPNRPGGPLNPSGVCFCTIPLMYGPNRVTC